MPDDTVEIVVGRVSRAHGLRGDVLVDVRTDEPERRFAPGTRLRTEAGELVVDAARQQGTRLLVSFAGVRGRDAAERLRGLELMLDVPARERPADDEEYYDHQLRGLLVRDQNGRSIGTVVGVLHLPAQDTLVVDADGNEALVPFVSEIVTAVDIGAGTLTLAGRPGLLGPVDASD